MIFSESTLFFTQTLNEFFCLRTGQGILCLKITKNKIAPPFREGFFRLLFDAGIDDIGSSILWLAEFDQDEYGSGGKGKSWFSFGGVKKQGLDDMIALIEEEGLEDELRNRVWDVWKQVYAMPVRKDKKRWN